jgi:heme exporter protein D
MLDLDAGKYALFVWPAFAITAFVFVLMIWFSLDFTYRYRDLFEDLEREEKDR